MFTITANQAAKDALNDAHALRGQALRSFISGLFDPKTQSAGHMMHPAE